LGDLIVTEVEIYEVGQSGEALYFWNQVFLEVETTEVGQVLEILNVGQRIPFQVYHF
jgi:hypothetical protein